ncbi:MAG: potassium channel family protein [Draconibacterium sp.]
MQSVVLSISLVFFTLSALAQNTSYKNYSYSEFYKLIRQEQDSIFSLENAIITFNQETDEEFKGFFNPNDSLYQSRPFPQKVIDKEIQLKNVIFKSRSIENQKYRGDEGVFFNFHFLKPLRLVDVYAFKCYKSKFEKNFYYWNSKVCDIDKSATEGFPNDIHFVSNEFKDAIFGLQCKSNRIYFQNNTFNLDDKKAYSFSMFLSVSDNFFTSLNGNIFNGPGVQRIEISKSEWFFLRNNSFNTLSNLSITEMQGVNRLYIKDNTFKEPVVLTIDKFYPINYVVEWKQFDKMLVADMGLGLYNSKEASENKQKPLSYRANIERYTDSVRIADEDAYAGETAFRGFFYNHYKSKFDTENANAVYVNLKDMETKRMAWLYKTNPSFDKFFTWKINQFLKVFSAYGTKPSRAIIFSLYVILIFALIYLFFPNSWDSHGKHRIIHRYLFFMKYMNRNQGIHEVYLEDKQHDLVAYEEFKQFIENHSKTVPRFFVATAVPLYRWALSGTKLTASFLSRFDVLKGTWQEVQPSQRWWKVILLIGAFSIAIVYDILIKILNALMLSINTFTTLGFGEIPIKGLPRYLAIIQGFIGWFMLTIFSVSLISQLLN